MDTDIEGYTVAWPLIVMIALVSALFFISVVWLALRARRRKVVSGAEEMDRSVGVALEDFEGIGRVRVHSEDWQARSLLPVRCGQQVRVIARDGLVLTVEPANMHTN
jgi:membrane-bound serine protease (ClpP class)